MRFSISAKLKRSAIIVLSAAVISGSLLLSGCSTPAVAATIDNTNFTSGEYLAYVYGTYQETFYNNGYYYYTCVG